MSYTRDTSKWGRLRDNLAWSICNMTLNYIATPWYRGMIHGSIILGLEKASND